MATIVSVVLNTGGRLAESYLRTAMITVFRNASPMLSDDICGSSATVR
jgi:hypothetical protein